MNEILQSLFHQIKSLVNHASSAWQSAVPPLKEMTMAALSGKTALVTGASRGIGRSSALALAKAGAQVLVHYGRGKDEAEAVVQEIRSAGGRAQALSADLASPNGPRALAAEV